MAHVCEAVGRGGAFTGGREAEADDGGEEDGPVGGAEPDDLQDHAAGLRLRPLGEEEGAWRGGGGGRKQLGQVFWALRAKTWFSLLFMRKLWITQI